MKEGEKRRKRGERNRKVEKEKEKSYLVEIEMASHLRQTVALIDDDVCRLSFLYSFLFYFILFYFSSSFDSALKFEV